MEVFALALTAALVTVGAVYLVVASRAPQFDYGRYRDQVFKSQAVLDREPCDRGAVVRLVNAKLNAGDNRGASPRRARSSRRAGISRDCAKRSLRRIAG